MAMMCHCILLALLLIYYILYKIENGCFLFTYPDANTLKVWKNLKTTCTFKILCKPLPQVYINFQILPNILSCLHQVMETGAPFYIS